METGRPVLGRKGKPLDGRGVNAILRNPIYKGTVIYNDHGYRKALENPMEGPRVKTKKYAKPKEEWVVDQREELRLVSDELWDTAQKNRLQNQRAGFGFGPKRASYLLTGLFHCGICGNSVGGHWQENRDGSNRYYYYRCRATMHGGKSCANKSKIRGVQVESAVIARIEAELFSKIFFEKVIDHAMAILEADRSGESGEMLAEKIKSLDAQIGNMARASRSRAGRD